MLAAEISSESGEPTLIIKNEKLHKVEASIPVLPPVLSLKWSPDSKSLVVVQHLAGGSLASLVILDGKQWKKNDCEPPLKIQCNYSLVNFQFVDKQLRLTYKVSQERANGEIVSFNICSFDVDLKTGFLELKEYRPVTAEAYKKLVFSGSANAQ